MVIGIEEVIEFLEMFDGCVKIFYLVIYGGLLVRCDIVEYMEVIVVYDIKLIDLVVVNLYFF